MEFPKSDIEQASQALDQSHKLFLICDLLRGEPKLNKKNSHLISQKILERSGVHLSSTECARVVNQYWSLLYRPYGVCIFLAICTSCSLFLMSGDYILGAMSASVFTPLLFTFYAEILISIHLFFLKEKTLIPSPCSDYHELGTVAIILVSRNEPFDVAKMTFDSAMAMTYPGGKKEIIVVDNSDASLDDTVLWKDYVQLYADGGALQKQEINVVFVHRDGVEGFKPRNLDIALRYVNSECIFYLDIDSTVLEDTLLRVMPIMQRDKSLAFVQLQAIPTNFCLSSNIAIANSIQNYKLRFDSIFLAHSSHTLFYGHNALWRTSAVREMGNCLEYYRNEVVVTEDLSMSLRTLFFGSYGIGVWLPSGEWVPVSMRETEAMWLRWTVGTYQVYANFLGDFKKLKKGKTIEMIGWAQHLLQLINNGLIPVYVLAGLLLNSRIALAMVAIQLFSQTLQVVGVNYKLSLGRMTFLKKAYCCYYSIFVLSTFISWIKLKGLFRFIVRKKQGWRPTGKGPAEVIARSQTLKEYWGFLLYGLFCMVFSAIFLLDIPPKNLCDNLILLCGLFYGVHCLFAVVIFGLDNRRDYNEPEPFQCTVKDMLDFY